MTEEQLKKAVELNGNLDTLNCILRHIYEYDKGHWWSFFAPGTDEDGIIMPDVLRTEFIKAVNRSVEIIQNEIKNL